MSDEQNTQQNNEVIAEVEQKTSALPVVPQLLTAGLLLSLIFGATYISDARTSLTRNTNTPQTSQPSTYDTEPETDPFDDIFIDAEAAFVWDIKEQRALYNKNADSQLPLASIAKLMTALIAYELLGSNAHIDITASAIGQEGDSSLLQGESFDVRNLIDFTLITSSNDGAYALASAASASIPHENKDVRTFVELMNIRAEEIGLSRTIFKNTTGLDTSEIESGAYGSARDVSFLMEYILTAYPSLLEMTREDHLYISNTFGLTHEAANTNSSVDTVPGILASKTGYTTLAGGNLVIAFDAGLNRPVIATVLGSSYSGRFSDVAQLIEATKSALAQTK